MIDITTLRTPITLNGCKTKRLIREKLAAVAADGYEGIEGFRKKDGSQISLRELSKEHLILSHRYRNYIISAFEAVGLTCDIYYECEDARTAMTIEKKGLEWQFCQSPCVCLTRCVFMALRTLILQPRYC